MSLAKIASGDGYEYYLRSIATHDANERGNQALSDYYSERGESPGRWWGTGLADLTIRDTDGVVVSSITAGDEVTEPQMWALFGRGLHPDAEALIAGEVAAKRAEGLSARTARAHAIRVKARIGMPFSTPSVEEFSYRAECRRAYEDWNTTHGHLPTAPVPDTDREQIATEVEAAPGIDDDARSELLEDPSPLVHSTWRPNLCLRRSTPSGKPRWCGPANSCATPMPSTRGE